MDDYKIYAISISAHNDKGFRWWTAWMHRPEGNCRQYNDITQASLERLQRAQKRIVTEQLPQATA